MLERVPTKRILVTVPTKRLQRILVTVPTKRVREYL